jgi:hypothetical protein
LLLYRNCDTRKPTTSDTVSSRIAVFVINRPSSYRKCSLAIHTQRAKHITIFLPLSVVDVVNSSSRLRRRRHLDDRLWTTTNSSCRCCCLRPHQTCRDQPSHLQPFQPPSSTDRARPDCRPEDSRRRPADTASVDVPMPVRHPCPWRLRQLRQRPEVAAGWSNTTAFSKHRGTTMATVEPASTPWMYVYKRRLKTGNYSRNDKNLPR